MWPFPWCMSSTPNHCLVRSVMLEEEGAAVRTTAGEVVQKERLIWFYHCVAVFMLRTLVMRQSSLRTRNSNLHLHSSSGTSVTPPTKKKKKRNADSVYAGGSDTSQSFNEGIVPIMSWWAALLTHNLSALLRVYRQPGSAVGSCGLSKSGMRLLESCQSDSLAAKGSQWTKQPDWWIN